jgi:hypothetical protein
MDYLSVGEGRGPIWEGFSWLSFTQRRESYDIFSSFTSSQDISGREINGFLLQYKITYKLEPFWEKPPKWGHSVF